MSASGTSSDVHGGRRVGKYETLTMLSIGGMAELYLAYTAGPGGFRKFVALKQILPDVKKDESFRKMFLDEARITASLSHANIAQVFDLGEDDGELYLAMEFIAGQNLEQVVKAAKKKEVELPIGYGAMAVRDTCLALHYAHHFVEPSGKPAPVIHRDVSPKNVMFTYDGNVKVVDFGIAKAKGRLNRTQAGMVKGTTSYMSPEQIRNEPLDGRSDLFSAAVMLHEFLTGKRLFDGQSDAQTMVQVVEGEVPDPRSLNPNVPKALADVVMKALSKDREQRYATGKELAKAIDAAAAEVMFDEDDAAKFMQDLFAEKVKKTRALLEMASKDDRDLSKAADQLRDEEGKGAGGTPGTRPARSPRTPAPKTPAPRTPPPSRTPPRRPSSPARAAPEDDAGAAEDAENTPPRASLRPQRTPPPRRAPPASAADDASSKDRWKSSVAQDYALYNDQEQETVRKPQSGSVRSPVASENATSVRPSVRRPAPAAEPKPPRSKAWVWLVLLVLVGGGAAYSLRMPGPVGDFSRTQYARAKDWVAKEFAGEPPPPPDAPLAVKAPTGRPPPQAALLPNPAAAETPGAPGPEAATAAGAAPAEQAAAPAGAGSSAAQPKDGVSGAIGSSDRTKTPGTSGAAGAIGSSDRTKTPGTSGAAGAIGSSDRTGGSASKTGTTGGVKPASGQGTTGGTRTRVAAQAAQTGENGLPNTTATQAEDDVEVLDTRTARGAEKDGVGWLSLYTVPPAWVYDGATRLGTTPLVKMPLPVGTYRLRVMDPESKYRTLSAPIKAGKVTELKIRVADLPLDPVQE